jgi:hypothetical protein
MFSSTDPKTKRESDLEMNLANVDEDGLELPETKYQCEVTMESCEFARICTAFEGLGRLLTLTVQPDYIKFSVDGPIGAG